MTIEQRKAAIKFMHDWREELGQMEQNDSMQGVCSFILELLQPSPPVADGEVDEAVKWAVAEMNYRIKEHGKIIGASAEMLETLIRAIQQQKPTREGQLSLCASGLISLLYQEPDDVQQIREYIVPELRKCLASEAQQPRQEFTDELIDLLHIMWDGYENGTPSYEYDFDNSLGGFLGNAFQIADDKETHICEILNKHRPVKPLPSPPKETR